MPGTHTGGRLGWMLWTLRSPPASPDTDRARAWTMLATAVALMPRRPRTALWIATREPAIGELQRTFRLARRAVWPEIGWVAVGVAGAILYGPAREFVHERLAAQAPPAPREPAPVPASDAKPVVASPVAA